MMFIEKASRCSTKVLMYATLGVASSKIYYQWGRVRMNGWMNE